MSEYSERLADAKRASIGQLLFRCARILNKHAIARFREESGLPLRVTHTRLFPEIDLEGTRLTDLAKRLGVSKQATNQWVDELVEMGMLERKQDPSDKRAKLICFSQTGKMGLLAGLSFLKGVEDELEEEMGKETLSQLHKGLLSIEAVLERWEAETE